jgi:hypothetical protein
VATVNTNPFVRLAGILSVFVGVGGLAYGILFAAIVEGAGVGVQRTWILLAVLGGLAACGVFAGLYERFRDVFPAVARLALLFGVLAGVGQLLNASVALGYSLETAPPPPGDFEGTPDPLGILRFGLNGVALFLFAWVMLRDGRVPKSLAYLGQLGGVLLVVMYVGRLTGIIDPAERITLIPPLLYGLAVHPIFYLWLGRELLRPPLRAPD